MHIWTMARKWQFTREKSGRYRDHRTGHFAKREDWERERGREPTPRPAKPVRPAATPRPAKPAVPVKKPPPAKVQVKQPVVLPPTLPPRPVPRPVREPAGVPSPVPVPVREPVSVPVAPEFPPVKPEPEMPVEIEPEMPVEMLGLGEDQPFPVEGQLMYRRGSGWIWS